VLVTAAQQHDRASERPIGMARSKLDIRYEHHSYQRVSGRLDMAPARFLKANIGGAAQSDYCALNPGYPTLLDLLFQRSIHLTKSSTGMGRAKK
jgi:hypothetical protein